MAGHLELHSLNRKHSKCDSRNDELNCFPFFFLPKFTFEIREYERNACHFIVTSSWIGINEYTHSFGCLVWQTWIEPTEQHSNDQDAWTRTLCTLYCQKSQRKNLSNAFCMHIINSLCLCAPSLLSFLIFAVVVGLFVAWLSEMKKKTLF